MKKKLKGVSQNKSDAVKANQGTDLVELLNLGLSLHQHGQLDTAKTIYGKIIQAQPHNHAVLHLMGVLAVQEKELNLAVDLLQKAIEIDASHSNYHSNLGLALNRLGRYGLAVLSFQKAIALQKNNSDYFFNLGLAQQALNRWVDAIASFQEAARLNPRDVDSLNNLGVIFKRLHKLDESLQCFKKVAEINPKYKYLHGTIMHTKMSMCDWSEFDQGIQALMLGISENMPASLPFPLLALTESMQAQRKAAQLYLDANHAYKPTLGALPKRKDKNKLRIGYFSSDFREHPVAYLTAELFELHDKDQFEIIGFYFGLNTSDDMHHRIAKAFDGFMDVRLKSEVEIAALAREYEIDIAVDLNGLTSDHRMDIFSFRAAPIQISYLGFLGTLPASYVDYLVADHVIVNEKNRMHIAEKVIYLPSYQANDSKRATSVAQPSREEFNLPQEGFLYCCFNSSFKINPQSFDIWMEILKAVPQSHLYLLAENEWVVKNLRQEAERRGVSASRLLFGPRIDRSEYFSRLKVADLFLDTWPYNAGTTASDALWTGLPVLTLAGQSFAGRIAASLLSAIGLPELIAQTPEQYVEMAIEFGLNPDLLQQTKNKLENNKTASKLFDTPRLVKSLETAYQKIYERLISNLPAEDVYL